MTLSRLSLFSRFIAKLIGMLVTVGNTNQFGVDLNPAYICHFIISSKRSKLYFGDSHYLLRQKLQMVYSEQSKITKFQNVIVAQIGKKSNLWE